MEDLTTVQTDFGPVRGFHKKLYYDNDCIAFQNIPYMKAPIGNLRFREPQPTEKWEEPLNASGNVLSYYSYFPGFPLTGQENAGILNIFTKNLNPENPYPVMVWVSVETN